MLVLTSCDSHKEEHLSDDAQQIGYKVLKTLKATVYITPLALNSFPKQGQVIYAKGGCCSSAWSPEHN